MEIPSTGGHDVTHAIGTIEIPVDSGPMEPETAQDVLSALPSANVAQK